MKREGLFFFTGPDAYFLAQEVHKWQQGFISKYGEDQCVVYTTDSITLPAVQESLQGGGLFSTKKLIICKNIPEDKTASVKVPKPIATFFEGLLEGDTPPYSADVLLVFVSIDPDKRTKLYKVLSEKATVKSFPVLSDGQLLGFIKQQLGDFFSQELADYLISYVGNDVFRIESECDKIRSYLAYTNQKQLSSKLYADIIFSPGQANSFGVLDALAQGDTKTMLRHIDEASSALTARPEFLGMLYRGLKHILQTIDLYKHGTKQAKDIAAIIGMHPFPIAKNVKHIQYLVEQEAHLKDVFHQLLLLDKEMKSGLFPQEGFWAEIKKILFAPKKK